MLSYNKILIIILLFASFLIFWGLDKVPVSLFGDELDLGYQAYSVLKTGRDYSGNFLPIHFRSLGEWRTPLYLYSAVPTVALFGISPWGVRLPSALFGLLSIYGIYLLTKEITGNRTLSLLSAFILSITPWYLHYSRIGFEVTQMLFLYIFGLYFFLTGINGRRNTLWISGICFALTPWAYSTAKLFTPILIIALLIIWYKQIKIIPLRRITIAIIVFLSIYIPFTYSLVFGGGFQRIADISIFNDPTIIPQIGFSRLNDINMRDVNAVDTQSANILDKLFHNPYIFYIKIFLDNYLKTFSTSFLFIHGDSINLRHSSGIELYPIEAIFLVLGLVFLFTGHLRKQIVYLIFFWILVSPIPASLTKGGGDHATRLILMLPFLNILVCLGVYFVYKYLKRKQFIIFSFICGLVLSISFIFYEHDYWLHYPWSSERWWHAGFEEMVKTALGQKNNYEKIIFSMSNEPVPIFFLGWSEYQPNEFKKKYPFEKELVGNFGNISKIDNYYFANSNTQIDLYSLASFLQPGMLYIAPEKEIKLNLTKEPWRIPDNIKLLKTINYPSGTPAFYMFTLDGKI